MHEYELPKNFNFKGLSLIDVTSEDDCLITSPHLAHNTDGKMEVDESRENGEQDLPRSMSWESSFFGTETFLEPEAMSSREDASRRGELKDMRASIQKSKRESGIATAGCSGVKRGLETKDSRAVPSSRMLSNSNHDKMKQKAAARKPTIASKEPGKTMKQVPARSKASQSVGRTGVSTSSLHKPPMDRRSSLSASLSANDTKVEKDAKVRKTTLSKTPALDGSRNAATTRTTLNSRPSSMNLIKQNKDSSLGNSTSFGHTTTSASKSAAEGRSQPGRSAASTLSKPSTRLHSSMSVAGSYADWSSVSSLSSSTSTASKRPNKVARASLGSGSHRGLVMDNDDRRLSDFHSLHSMGAEDNGSLDGRTELHPAAIKHSGIRSSSPKPPSTNGLRSTHSRTPSISGAPNDMPKTGAKSTNPIGGSNKATPRTLQQSTSAARKVRSDTDSRNPKISPGMPPKLQNTPSQNKAQGIGSAEKIAGSDKPKLVVKPGGRVGARTNEAKVVPLPVPDY